MCNAVVDGLFLSNNYSFCLFQACQGTSPGEGISKEPTDRRNIEMIPIWQDFLIIYGTFPGETGLFFDGGSRFTASFYKILSGSASNSLDLISLLTLVNRDVSEMGSDDKQMSHYQSTLIRFLKLKKRETEGIPKGRFDEDEVDTPMHVDDEQLPRKEGQTKQLTASTFTSPLTYKP